MFCCFLGQLGHSRECLCALSEQFALFAYGFGKPGPLIKYLLVLKEGEGKAGLHTADIALVPLSTPL